MEIQRVNKRLLEINDELREIKSKLENIGNGDSTELAKRFQELSIESTNLIARGQELEKIPFEESVEFLAKKAQLEAQRDLELAQADAKAAKQNLARAKANQGAGWGMLGLGLLGMWFLGGSDD